MPILDLQVRARELGRIRIGQVVQAANGKTRPSKLDRFRLTSPSKALLDEVAKLYGGGVVDWSPQGGGPDQYEVITTATRLPVLIPPQPVSQFYEHWAAGGCKRRCDGVTELIGDVPCVCGPDPVGRLCKPTTRLNVVLRDVPGIGVWRLESHGYYSAVELPQVAGFLAQASGYIQAFLALEERVVKREVDGKPETRRFMVPTLEVDVTPAELLAGGGGISPAAVDARKAPAAIEAPRDWLAEAKAAITADEVRALWHEAKNAGVMDDDLNAALLEVAQALPAAAVELDPDALWQQIIAACPEGMTLSELEQDFAAENEGTFPGSATPEQLQAYLAQQAAA